MYLSNFSSPRTTPSQAFSVNAFRERYCLKPRANRRNIVGQHFPTLLHGFCMLRPFAHPVACCSLLLGVVVQSLKPVKLSYVQTDAATLNIVGHGQETPKLVRTFVTRNVQAARNNEVRD